MFKQVSPLTLLSSGDIPEWAFNVSRAILESLRQVDPVTYKHCLRVGDGARRLSKDLGLTEYQQRLAEFSGVLHDVGKMGVDQAIVHKPGKLNDLEMDQMKSHVILSVKIIEPLAINNDFFQQVSTAVRGHHERIDGMGYPDRVIGDEIPLLSRVISIVDTLDAMGQDRSYRKGLSVDVIYNEIKRCSGTQFDIHLAKVFLESHAYWQKNNEEQVQIQENRLRIFKTAA